MTPPAAAAAPGRTLPRGRAGSVSRAPRRVSGPAARPKRGADTARPRRAAAPDPFIIRAIERTIRMADSRFLDRLIRGRLWIPLVAAGLMGIVFMQVSMLKLNAGIGRAVQSAATLERQNATMRAQVSGAEAGSKIDQTAKQIGMVAPAASTTPSYVKVGGTAQAQAAARRMTPADPDAVAREKAAASTIGSAVAGPSGVAPATSTTTGVTATTTGAATTTGTATATGAGTTTGAGTATTAATSTGTATGAATTGATSTPSTGAATTGATGTGTTTGTGTGTGTATGGTATGTGTATGAATTGATGTATATPTTQQQQSSTSGGAVAPTAG